MLAQNLPQVTVNVGGPTTEKANPLTDDPGPGLNLREEEYTNTVTSPMTSNDLFLLKVESPKGTINS